MHYIILILLLFSSLHVFSENNFKSGYKVVTVGSIPLNRRVVLGGRVVPKVEVNLLSQVSGDVIEVLGQEGDFFREGELLVRLEKESLKAELSSVYAEIDSAKEVIRNAEVQYSKSIISPDADANRMLGGVPGLFSMFTDPMRNFTNRGDSSFEKYANRTNSYSNYAQAKNRLKQAYAHLKQVKEKLEDANVQAPFDGMIVSKFINKGDIVNLGQKIISFSNVKDLQIEVQVPARYIFNLVKGNFYKVRINSSKIINARLKQIYPIANNQSHTVRVKFDLPSGILAIAGTYAEVEIIEEFSNKEIAVIPESAILYRSSLPSVYIVNYQNKLELKFIRLGEKLQNGRYSVLSGINIGDRVIKNPDFLIKSKIVLNN